MRLLVVVVILILYHKWTYTETTDTGKTHEQPQNLTQGKRKTLAHPLPEVVSVSPDKSVTTIHRTGMLFNVGLYSEKE